jgi:cytoskeletal protein RodZ
MKCVFIFKRKCRILDERIQNNQTMKNMLRILTALFVAITFSFSYSFAQSTETAPASEKVVQKVETPSPAAKASCADKASTSKASCASMKTSGKACCASKGSASASATPKAAPNAPDGLKKVALTTEQQKVAKSKVDKID